MLRGGLALALLALCAAPAGAEVRLGADAADVDRALRAPAPDAPGLRVERVSAYPEGEGEKYVQTWRGLDVVGGDAFVRKDGAGRVRWASLETRAVPADLDPTPGRSAAQILAALGRDDLDPAAHARLVVWAPPGRRPRLAYQVVLPADLDKLQTLRLMVDAGGGDLLWAENLVKREARARVFPSNPAVSTLTTVALDLPAGATRLAGAEIAALNCIDRMTCPLDKGGTRMRWCETIPLAAADESGDFLYDRPIDDAALEDPFSEVQMYYHATRALAFFRGFGFAGLRRQPMTAYVNLRMPDLSKAACHGTPSDVPLAPLENALFMPAGGIGNFFPPADAMVFGQGKKIDYAYDGDVVTHELTHAVASTLTEMGQLATDEHGLDGSMAAMHEAFADYFSSALAGDPEVAEYVGTALLGKPSSLRSLANQAGCPADLTGEEHDDSEIFSGALWSIRAGLAEDDRARFDQAVYTVLDSLGSVETFDSVRAKIVAETGVVLGEAAAGAAGAVFAARGLDACVARVQSLAIGEAKRFLFLHGAKELGVTMAIPSVVQLRVTLSMPAHEIRVRAEKSADGTDAGHGVASLRMLVKRDAPIAWNEDTLANDAAASGALALGSCASPPASGRVRGDFPAGVYYVQLTNGGDDWWLGRIAVTTDVEGNVDGGGCALGGGPGGGWAAWLVVGLLLARRRIHRRGRSGPARTLPRPARTPIRTRRGPRPRRRTWPGRTNGICGSARWRPRSPPRDICTSPRRRSGRAGRREDGRSSAAGRTRRTPKTVEGRRRSAGCAR